MKSLVLSEEEKHYIISGIQDDCRTDGRSIEDYRMINVQTAVVSNTNGSAQVKLSGTNVIVGIKAIVSEVLASTPYEGRIEFFVDCSANASPVFEGRGGDDLALELSKSLERTFCQGSLDLSSLCIIPGKSCWTLYIDALILECGGNLFDALSIGIKSALSDTRIPNLTVIGEGEEQDFEVSDDPYDSTPIDISNVPLLITLNKIGNRFVVDATPEEEVCSDAHLLISINERGNCCSVQKRGQCGIHPDLLFEMMQIGKNIGTDLNKKLDELLQTIVEVEDNT